LCDKHQFLFEFDKAFTRQLIEKFEASPSHQLSEDVAPSAKGVYALYRHGRIVYAGKALQTTLRRRLGEHARKITGRKNIELREMTCRFLIIDSDWFVRAGEHALIETYDPQWNLSGFGSHVPGIGRPGIRPSKWDTEFPPR
jgi:Eco29kI restriction endonuclease